MPSRDLISQLKELSKSMTRAEARIANVILEDIEATIHSSTTEIAKRANTSTPTVTRFCRTLGFEGLKEFKLSMAKAVAVERHYLKQDLPVTIDLSPIPKAVIDQAKCTLDMLLGQINLPALEQVAQRIAHCRRLVVFGSGGGSSIIADEVVNRFFRLGLQVNAYHDVLLFRMVLACLNEQDVVLVISTSGQYHELIQCIEVANDYKPFTVAMTRPDSLLAHAVHAVLPVDIAENDNIFMPTESRFALLAMTDILATSTATLIGQPAVELMRRIKHQLVVHFDPEGKQPLGD